MNQEKLCTLRDYLDDCRLRLMNSAKFRAGVDQQDLELDDNELLVLINLLNLAIEGC
jgi:hypothetical protein